MNRVGLARFRALSAPAPLPMAGRPRGRRCQFPEGTVRVNLLVSPETYAALDRRARAEGHSISQEARAALDRHLAR